MPRQLLFRNHADLRYDELHEHYLYGNPLVPTDLLLLYFQDRGQDYFKEYGGASSDARALWDRRLGGPRPLMHWMCSIVSDIERELGEAFSWSFERHYLCWEGDEDSEYVFKAGPASWIVTIRDFEGVIVHKHWAIGVSESFGDLLIERGTPGSAHDFRCDKWTEIRRIFLPRLLAAIREHQRIRNFRLKRTV